MFTVGELQYTLTPNWKNTQFHQELHRNLVIAPKISAYPRHKLVIYISALYVLCYSLVLYAV